MRLQPPEGQEVRGTLEALKLGGLEPLDVPGALESQHPLWERNREKTVTGSCGTTTVFQLLESEVGLIFFVGIPTSGAFWLKFLTGILEIPTSQFRWNVLIISMWLKTWLHNKFMEYIWIWYIWIRAYINGLDNYEVPVIEQALLLNRSCLVQCFSAFHLTLHRCSVWQSLDLAG